MKTTEKFDTKSQKMFKQLQNAKSIAIFTHVNPDPDAYGSAFAFRQMFRDLGKMAEIFAVKNAEGSLDEIFPLNELRTDFKAADFDAVILVDANEILRVHESFVTGIKKAKELFFFDHHVQEKVDIKNSLIDNNCASCTQLLTHVMQVNNLKITPEIATYLYAGLIGDTDRFLHNNLSHDVFETAIVLFDAGADAQFVYDKLYRSNTMKSIDVQNKFFKNTKFENNGKTCYTIFTLKNLKKLGVDQEFVKNYTNCTINLVGVLATFLCIEYKKNSFKISIRTKQLNAQKFAKNFDGGGHVCASGFVFNGSFSQLKKAAKDWCKEILKYNQI